jgi:hypothetical protein
VQIANLFISRNLAESTRATYASAVSSYEKFCRLFGVEFECPISDELMCVFVTHLATRTSPPPVQYATIKNYAFGLQSYHSDHGHEKWLSTLTMYHKCMRGLKRHLGDTSKQLHRERLPITTSLLAQVRTKLTLGRSNQAHVVFWAAATLGTYGLLRMGEFCPKSNESARFASTAIANSSSPVAQTILQSLTSPESGSAKYRLLTLALVKLYTADHLLVPIHQRHLYNSVSYYTILLRMSKTDQDRKGAEVVIANPIPVDAMKMLLELHPKLSGLAPSRVAPSFSSVLSSLPASVASAPLFLFGDNTILSRPIMIEMTRIVIASLGLDASRYHGHSFRRGGATSLSERGVDHDMIKAMGRWKSDAYQRYIVTSREKIIENSCTM